MDNPETTTTAMERGFAEGELVVLRPVKEDDLRPLAQLMAENPYEHDPTPWTHQRLKQKFEDKEKPGLWERESKVYSVVRKIGDVVGYIREATQWENMCWCELHIHDGLADRDEHGRDLLATYLRYKQRWHKPRRISFALLMLEEQKIGWLTAAGFEQELVFDAAALHLGEPVAIAYFTWIADWALALRAEPQAVAGEDNPRRN